MARQRLGQTPSRISYSCQSLLGSSRPPRAGNQSVIVMHRTGRKTRLPRRPAFATWAPHVVGSLPVAKPSLVYTKPLLASPRQLLLLRAGRSRGGFVLVPPSA